MAVRSWGSGASAQNAVRSRTGESFEVFSDPASQERSGKIPGGLFRRCEF